MCTAPYTSSFFSLSVFFFVPPLCLINKDFGGITISSIFPCDEIFPGRSTYGCNPSTRCQLICRPYHLLCYIYYPMFVRHEALWMHTGCGRLLGLKKSFNSYRLQVYRRNNLDIFHHNKENVCDQCGEKFPNHEELISHARHVHHHTIVKCHECGKEFIHEKDRLHHVREEHKKKVESREQKNLHNTK